MTQAAKNAGRFVFLSPTGVLYPERVGCAGKGSHQKNTICLFAGEEDGKGGGLRFFLEVVAERPFPKPHRGTRPRPRLLCPPAKIPRIYEIPGLHKRAGRGSRIQELQHICPFKPRSSLAFNEAFVLLGRRPKIKLFSDGIKGQIPGDEAAPIPLGKERSLAGEEGSLRPGGRLSLGTSPPTSRCDAPLRASVSAQLSEGHQHQVPLLGCPRDSCGCLALSESGRWDSPLLLPGCFHTASASRDAAALAPPAPRLLSCLCQGMRAWWAGGELPGCPPCLAARQHPKAFELMARDGTETCPGNPGAAGIQVSPCSLEDDEVFLGTEMRPSAAQAGPFRHCSVEELYELLETLGSGHFGVVRRCKERSTGVFYAAKSIKVRKRKGSRLGLDREQVEREVCILQQLQHPNIMRLYDVFANQAEMVLILELILGGELFDFIAEKELLSEDEAIEFLQQILLGLAYMHALRIAHFDLKPENIMLLVKDAPNPKIKIIDFGLAQKLEEGVAYKSLCGTPQYIAPEVINYEALSTATDMWSIGVITYILLSGMSPFQGETDEETLSNVVSGNYEFEAKYFSQTSEMAKDFIQKLLLKEPRDRMTATECLLHPWIKPLTRKQAMNRSRSSINMKNFRKFNARRKWKLSFHMVSACNRLCRLRLLCQQQKPDEEATALRDCESDQEDQPCSPGVLLRRRRSICS